MTRAEALWSRLHDDIQHMQRIASRAYVTLCDIGSMWRHETFPEHHARELADRLEAIAAGLRDSARIAEERRKEAA